MLCPKCKTEILDNEYVCSNCKLKIRANCPACGAINKVNALTCQSCGEELLKKCPSCGAINLKNAKVCRKCEASLIEQKELNYIPESEDEIETKPLVENTENDSENSVFNLNLDVSANVQDLPKLAGEDENEDSENAPDLDKPKEQLILKNLVIQSLVNSDKLLHFITSEEGNGKSLVLQNIVAEMNRLQYFVWWGEATPISQLSPFGLFQDIILSYLDWPNYDVPEQNSHKDLIKTIEKTFGINHSDAVAILDIIYPIKTAYYEDILHNRETTKELLKKILFQIKLNKKTIIAIDDFDLIDASSFDLLVELSKDGYFDASSKLVLTAQNQKNIDGFIALTNSSEFVYEKYFLASFNEPQLKEFITMFLNGQNPIPEEIFNQIIQNSNGSPAYIQQVLLLLNEVGAFTFNGNDLVFNEEAVSFELPTDIANVIYKRLDKIQKDFPMVYKALIMAALLGTKFDTFMLQASLDMDEVSFQNLIQDMQNLSFIKLITNEYSAFVNSLVWKNVFNYVKKDVDFAKFNFDILEQISPLNLSYIAYRPLFAQHAKDSMLAFENWNKVVKLSAYLGDVNLYVIAQKQCLKLIEDLTLDNVTTIDKNIKSRLGKLIYKSEPTLALDYLTAVLSLDLSKNDIISFIDLSSNAIIAANTTANYHAIMEIVDSIISLLDKDSYTLEIALITTRKIKTMLYLGNFEQVINTVQNDINPVLEDALAQNYSAPNLPIYSVYDAWVESNLIKIEAMILQGSNRVKSVFDVVKNAIKNQSHLNDVYTLKLEFLKAFSLTMIGEIPQSEKIINEITHTKTEFQIADEFVSHINMLQILNKLFKSDYTNIKNQMYEAVIFANNCNDYLTKHILRTVLGKIIELEGNYVKSLEIYNSQITFFAKEKVAIGALLTWYLIAELYIRTSEIDKALDIANNALDVAKNPKIISYYFQVLYQKLMAEIYLIKEDFEAAQMYVEQALLIVKNFNLTILNIQLYDFYAKYYIEIYKTNRDKTVTPLLKAKEMYNNAIKTAKDLGLDIQVKNMEKELQTMLTFCQLNKIELE